MWILEKNVLVQEIQLCKALSIGRHLEISSVLLMSTENSKTLTFVSLKVCFLGFVHRHNEFSSAICGVSSIDSQVLTKYKSELMRKERPHIAQLCIIHLWLGLFMLRCVRSRCKIFVASVLHFSASLKQAT